jgi:hypothetical protein
MICVVVTDTGSDAVCPSAPVIVNEHVPAATAVTEKLPLPLAGEIVAIPLQFVVELVNVAFPDWVAVTDCAALGTAINDTEGGASVTAAGGGFVGVGLGAGVAVGGAVGGVVGTAVAGATRIP